MPSRGVRRVRVLIADNYAIVREGLRRLCEAEADFAVVGEAADGAEAASLARELKPDVMLLDLAISRVPGLDVLRDLGGQVPIILLTAAIEREEIVTALQLGARGIVFKSRAWDVLLKGIRHVTAGQYWVGS